MNEIFNEVLTACGLLLWPAALAFFVCLFKGIRAEIRERKEARRHG